MALFGGLSRAKDLGNTRNPDPRPGRMICLLDSSAYIIPDRSPSNFVKLKMTVAVPLMDSKGMKFGEEGYESNEPLDKIDVAYFEDKDGYGASDVKKFALAAFNATPDMLVDAPSLTAEETAAGKLCAAEFDTGHVGSLLGVDDRGIPNGESGVFNGKMFIEIQAVSKIPTVKDASGAKVPKTDKDGNIVEYINTYVQRRVSFEEMATLLEDKTVERLFGSSDKFIELAAEDAMFME